MCVNMEKIIINNNKIMYKILINIPFHRQLIFRLISKRMNNIILTHPSFSKNCIIYIHDNNDNNNNNNTDLDQILTIFLQSISKPWKNYKFNCKTLNNSSEIQVKFWQMKGIYIQSLNFQNHNLGQITFLEILLACPNLEELSFNCQQIYVSDFNTYLYQFEEDTNTGPTTNTSSSHKLIPHLEMMKECGVLNKLKTLCIFGSNSMPSDILRDFLQWGSNLSSITLSDKNEYYPNLPKWDVRHIIHMIENRSKYFTRLELTGSHIQPEHILALSKIKDLKLLSVRFQFAQITEKCLSYFFRKQKSLEELDLSFTQISEKSFIHPSCTFQKLKKLNISGFTDSLKYLSFLSRMPNIEFINLSSSRTKFMTWDILVSGFLPIKLKKLQSLDLSYNMTLGTFQKQNLFNNLVFCNQQITYLNLSANVSIKDSFLQIIWKNMFALKIIFLEYLTTITNEGIIGIRQTQLQIPESSGKLDAVDPGYLRSQNKNSCYIGDCPNIQILSLAYATRLTDLAIQFGIKNLPKLQKLKLTSCGHLTDRTMFHLATGCLNLTFLDISETGITEPWVDWAKSSLPGLKRILITEENNSHTSIPTSSKITSFEESKMTWEIQQQQDINQNYM